ncbi:MAG: hypothetical protein GKS01_15900 [Alphaproteobacteria bacterium]|nr:hypothetical protein [Alphaproteobacteria bacterium]
MRSFITTAIFCFAIIIVYSASAQTVTVTKEDCARLVQHVPNQGVAYRPGVDAYGRKVIPADLGGGLRIKAPKEFSIPITMDLQKLLGLPVDPNFFQTQNFTVGTVNFKNGRAYFNDQPLQNEQAAKLSELCQKRMSAGR